jgi:hypothetical protein
MATMGAGGDDGEGMTLDTVETDILPLVSAPRMMMFVSYVSR